MLVDLNADQLAAAQHGDGPLLIVAGAGTGKTATLVHRVAHLIERGADPRRILLLTFTRRAAAEMLRRVEAVLAARGHSLRRRVGPRLGRHLPRHGRAPAARARARHRHAARLHDHGPRRQRRPAARRAHASGPRPRRLAVPAEVHQPRRLLALRQRPAAAARGAHHGLPLVPHGGGGPGAAVRRVHGRQRGAAGARLRRPAALLARPARGPRRRRPGPRALRPRARRRVPGHQRAAGGHRRPAAAGRHRRDLRRRRRPGHLRLPRRHGAQHPRLRAAVPRRGGRHAHAELPQHRAHPRRHQRAHRRGRRAARQGALDGAQTTAAARCSPPAATRTSRRSGSASASSRTASRARSSRSRPCSSARSTTAWRSRWSSAAATSPSTSTAGCGSSRWRTSRTS